MSHHSEGVHVSQIVERFEDDLSPASVTVDEGKTEERGKVETQDKAETEGQVIDAGSDSPA